MSKITRVLKAENNKLTGNEKMKQQEGGDQDE